MRARRTRIQSLLLVSMFAIGATDARSVAAGNNSEDVIVVDGQGNVEGQIEAIYDAKCRAGVVR